MKKATLSQRSPSWLRWILTALFIVIFLAVISVPVGVVVGYWFMPTLYEKGLDRWQKRGWEVSSAPLERSWDGLSVTAKLSGIAATHPDQKIDIAAKDVSLRIDFGLFANNVIVISEHTAVEVIDKNDDVVRVDVSQATASSAIQWFDIDFSEAHWDADITSREALLSMDGDNAENLNSALLAINALQSQAGKQFKELKNVINNVINDTDKVIKDVEALKNDLTNDLNDIDLNDIEQGKVNPRDLLEDKKDLLPKGIKPFGMSPDDSNTILRGHHGEDMLNFSTHEEPLAQAERDPASSDDHQEGGYGILHDLPLGFNFATARDEALRSRENQLVSPVEKTLVQYLWIDTISARVAIDAIQQDIVDVVSFDINNVNLVHRRQSLRDQDIAVNIQEIAAKIDASFPRDSVVRSVKTRTVKPLCDAMVSQTGFVSLSSLYVKEKERNLIYMEGKTTLDNLYYPQGSGIVRVPLKLPVALAISEESLSQPIEIGMVFNQQNVTFTQPILPPQTVPQPSFLNMSTLCNTNF